MTPDSANLSPPGCASTGLSSSAMERRFLAPISEKLNRNQGISVADVLRHEAGYASYPTKLDSADLVLTENIKQNSIGKVRAKFCEVGNVLMTNMYYDSVDCALSDL